MSKGTKMVRQTRPAPMLRETAQRVWLAGLGALAMAEEEGGKMFKTLVRKGQGYERVNKARIQSMVERVEDTVEDVRDGAGKTFDRFGVNLDERMEPVLHRLGFPTRREIGTLSRRVEELTRTLEKRGRTPATRRPVRRAAGRKTVTAAAAS